MSFVLVGSALLTAGAGIYTANQASNAQQDSIQSAERSSAAGLAAQNAATRQQLELARPLVETRDNALRSLQTLFGLPQSAPTRFQGGVGTGTGTGAGPNSGTGGAPLIALPGVRAQLSRGTRGSQGAIDFLGVFNEPGTPGQSIDRLFYDTGSGAIVDGQGDLVANVPEGGGLIPGLVHGKDNQIAIGPDGSVTSVGSRGQNVLAIPRLARAPAPAAAAAQAGGPTATDVAGTTTTATPAPAPADQRNALIDSLMNTPGIRFVDEQGRRELEQMMAARGLRNSGRALEAGIQRASDLASTNYQNLVLNPLFELAGFGQRGATSASDALAQQGNNVSANQRTLAELALQSGNARASSFQAQGQVVGDLASNLAGIYSRNGGFGGADPKTGTASVSRGPSLVSAAPATGYIVNGPNGAFNDPTGLYSSIYGGN